MVSGVNIKGNFHEKKQKLYGQGKKEIIYLEEDELESENNWHFVVTRVDAIRASDGRDIIFYTTA